MGPDFEKFLRVLEEKGTITFNNGTIRGPDGLWGHYILGVYASDIYAHQLTLTYYDSFVRSGLGASGRCCWAGDMGCPKDSGGGKGCCRTKGFTPTQR